MVELADTTDLKSVEYWIRAGSSPAFPTIFKMTKKQICKKLDKITGEIDGLNYNFYDEANKDFFESVSLATTTMLGDLHDVIERDDATRSAMK